MPVYESTKDTVIDGINIQQGRRHYSSYFNPAVWTFLTLISDDNLNPYVELYFGTIAAFTQVQNVCEYPEVHIHNTSGAVLRVSFNNNADIHIANNAVYYFSNADRHIDRIDIAGAGAGNVHIIGVAR